VVSESIAQANEVLTRSIALALEAIPDTYLLTCVVEWK
jgi:hypothetical protein